MKFQVNSELQYNVNMPTTFIFSIHALRTINQAILEESLIIDPYIRMEEFTSVSNPNRFMRIEVLEPMTFTISYKAVVDTNYSVVNNQIENDPKSIPKLDADVIPYLFQSRYCQSDKLQRLAYNQFGQIHNLYEKVQAVTDWIYNNVAYNSGTTDVHTSALDTISERTGVCRDFAHLGIALCRALSIPARYFTAYANNLFPQDFHACFEAYIGGQWIVFDATKLAPLNGMVKIANGRDAADASIASIFGSANSASIYVNCTCIDDSFVPILYNNDNNQYVSY